MEQSERLLVLNALFRPTNAKDDDEQTAFTLIEAIGKQIGIKK